MMPGTSILAKTMGVTEKWIKMGHIHRPLIRKIIKIRKITEIMNQRI